MNTVEYIVANGEIAHYEQFLHLSKYFQKSSAADALKWIYRWERVNWDPKLLDMAHICMGNAIGKCYNIYVFMILVIQIWQEMMNMLSFFMILIQT